MNRMFNCWPVIIYVEFSLLSISTIPFMSNEKLKVQKETKETVLFKNIVWLLIGYVILFALCYYFQ